MTAKYFARRWNVGGGSLCALCMALPLPVAWPAFAACPAGLVLHVVSDTPLTLDGSFVSSHSYASLGPPSLATPIPGLPARVGLRGLAVDASGVRFIPDTGVTLDGNFHPRGSVVSWDGKSFSAVDLGVLDASTPLRAWSEQGDTRYAVLENDLDIGGQYIGPRDVLISVDGGQWAFDRIGQHSDLPKRARINAFAAIDAHHWLLSFDTGLTLGGTYYRPSDLICYERQSRSFSLAKSLTTDSPRWHVARPVGLSAAPLDTVIFSDGFE